MIKLYTLLTLCVLSLNVYSQDLFVQELSLISPGSGFAANTQLRVKVGNTSTAKARNCTLGYYLSTDTKFELKDKFLSETAIIQLPGTGSYAFEDYVDLAKVGPGTYYLFAFVDNKKVVAESNENNNAKPLQIVISSLPDLTASIEVYSPLYAGRYGWGKTTTVTNFGDANSSPNRIGYYLSLDSIFDNGDVFIFSDFSFSVPAHSSQSVPGEFYIPAEITPGPYYLC